jgi:PAS domain S-box-containing protein
VHRNFGISSFCCRPGLRFVHRVLVAAWLWAAVAALVAAQPLATNLAQVTALSPQVATQGIPSRIEATATLYVPTWKLLFLQDDDVVGFCDPGPVRFAFSSGDRVRLTGTSDARGKWVFMRPGTAEKLGENAFPEPRRLTLEELASGRFRNRFAELTARVVSPVMETGGYPTFMVSDGTRTNRVVIFEKSVERFPQIQGSSVTLRGVAAQGGSQPGELFVPYLSSVVFNFTGTPDPFSLPLQLAAFAQSQVEAAPHAIFMRLTGWLLTNDAGNLALRDASGEIAVDPTFETLRGAGQEVDLIGWATVQDGEVRLKGGVWRPAGAPSLPFRTRRVNTTVAEVKRNPAAFTNSFAVVRALVTYSDPDWRSICLEDDTAAMFVEATEPCAAGDVVEADLAVAMTSSGPAVRLRHCRVLGKRPLPAHAPISDPSEFLKNSGRRIEITGVPISIVPTFPRARMVIALDGHTRVAAYVLNTTPEKLSRIGGALVRLRGNAAAVRDAGGESNRFFIVHSDDIQVATPAESLPLVRISDLRRREENRPSRIQGTLVTHRAGESILINDGTGTLLLSDSSAVPIAPGTAITAIGFPGADGSRAVLRNHIVLVNGALPTWQGASTPNPFPPGTVFTDAATIRALSVEDASRALPVKLRGVLTYSDVEWTSTFFQDNTAGIYINGVKRTDFFPAGTLVEVEGFTGPGAYAPEVVKPTVRALRKTPYPAPRHVTLDHLLSGTEDSQWVQIQGLVRSAEVDGPHTMLTVSTRAGMFKAAVYGNKPPTNLVDAVVNIRGACGTIFNERRQLTGIQLFVPSFQEIDLVAPPVPDPFATPVQPIHEALAFNGSGGGLRRAHIRGTVIHSDERDFLFVQDDSGGVKIHVQKMPAVRPGDLIEAAGFPVLNSFVPILQDATVRRVRSGAMPIPLVLRAEFALDSAFDSRWVQAEGLVLNATAQAGGESLVLKLGHHVFDVQRAMTEGEPPIRPGSVVRVTGVYLVQANEWRTPTAFRLLVPANSPVLVLSAPSWWTTRHTSLVVGGMGLLILGSVAWVVALRRRVGAQTRQIRQRLESEAALERRHRDLIANANDIIFTHDEHGRFLSMNPAGLRLLGYEENEIRALTIHEIVVSTQHALLNSKLEQILRREEVPTFELDLVGRSGARMAVELNAHTISEGAQKTVQGIARDITARRQAQQAREQIERKLQEAQKLESLGVLAGGIAHDFNNLLTGIMGNASLARMDLPANSPMAEYMQQIEAASTRAADLCKQMLAYSGKGRFVIKTLSLSDLVRDTTQLLQVSISKKAALKLELDDSLPPVQVDATQIRQVIMNLVINASEALGEDGGTIVVRTRLSTVNAQLLHDAMHSGSAKPGTYVALEVEDNGCGMTAETRARIFDPFFTTKFTGRGLGLAAVLGIVRGHNGVLDVWSEPGRGSRFTFLLPPAEGKTSPQTETIDTGHVPQVQGSVLIVDDEPAVRGVSVRILQKMGLKTEEAADGLEGLKKLRASGQRFDLVLLDLTMPNLDGEQVLMQLRQIHPEMPVVLMSGFSEMEASARFAGKGLSAFVQKPFTREALAAAVEQALQRRSAVTV